MISDAGTSKASAILKSISTDGFFAPLASRLIYDEEISIRPAISSWLKSFKCRNRRMIGPKAGEVFFLDILSVETIAIFPSWS